MFYRQPILANPHTATTKLAKPFLLKRILFLMPLVSCPALADYQAEQECRAQYYNDLDAAYGDAGRKLTAEENYKKCLRDIENKETISVRGQRSPSVTVQHGMFFAPMHYGSYSSTNSMYTPTSSGGSYLSTEDQDKAKEKLCEDGKNSANEQHSICKKGILEGYSQVLYLFCHGLYDETHSLSISASASAFLGSYQGSFTRNNYEQCKDQIDSHREASIAGCDVERDRKIVLICNG